MGKWPWRCTTTGLNNSTELRTEKIRQAVTEMWVPQIWQPPARPPARTVTTIPLQPGGLRGKNLPRFEIFTHHVYFLSVKRFRTQPFTIVTGLHLSINCTIIGTIRTCDGDRKLFRKRSLIHSSSLNNSLFSVDKNWHYIDVVRASMRTKVTLKRCNFPNNIS